MHRCCAAETKGGYAFCTGMQRSVGLSDACPGSCCLVRLRTCPEVRASFVTGAFSCSTYTCLGTFSCWRQIKCYVETGQAILLAWQTACGQQALACLWCVMRGSVGRTTVVCYQLVSSHRSATQCVGRDVSGVHHCLGCTPTIWCLRCACTPSICQPYAAQLHPSCRKPRRSSPNVCPLVPPHLCAHALQHTVRRSCAVTNGAHAK
jgi:hypothetical protein